MARGIDIAGGIALAVSAAAAGVTLAVLAWGGEPSHGSPYSPLDALVLVVGTVMAIAAWIVGLGAFVIGTVRRGERRLSVLGLGACVALAASVAIFAWARLGLP